MNEVENQNNQQGFNAESTEQKPPMPSSNLVMAILTTIFCCLPFGIVGILKAAKVNSLYLTGQYEAAIKASQDAKKWSMIGIICGAIGIVLYLVFAFSAGALSEA